MRRDILAEEGLRATGLACERDGRMLFEDLALSLDSGQILQVEGANGAGKTTLLRILCGLNREYTGEISWRGLSVRRHAHHLHRDLIYLGHSAGIKLALSPLENLRWYAHMAVACPDDAIVDAIAEVGLAGYEDVACFSLSAGQQRRVALARLLLEPASLWILDEPFTAIDRAGVAALERRLLRHADAGGMVLVTTHQRLSFGDTVAKLHLGAAA